MAPSNPGHAGPSEIARRAARELAIIQAALADVEEGIAVSELACGARDSAALQAMQSLDRLRQSAEGMATFLGRWAHHLPEGPPVGIDDLVADLALRELSDRLRGAETSTARGGQVDLF